jgi:hypothetical protein
MRRHKSKLADIPAVPEAVTQVSTKAMEAAEEALEDLAERAATVADRASSALGGIAETVRPKRKRHPFRWMVLLAGAGGAAYVAIRAGVPDKVRSVVGGGNHQPPEDYEPSAPEPGSPPSISVTGSPDEAAVERPSGDGSVTNGTPQEATASDASRGDTPG